MLERDNYRKSRNIRNGAEALDWHGRIGLIHYSLIKRKIDRND